MNIKIVVTKKSNANLVRMFERASKIFPTTFVNQKIVKQEDQITRINEVENVRNLEIERRGF
jgi:hypothetical protein